MLIRARFVVPCFLFAFAAGLAPACSSSSTGGSVCSDICQLLLVTCPTSECTFSDASAAVSACASACGTALETIPASEGDAVTSCFSCVTSVAAGSCSLLTTAFNGGAGQCASACDASTFEKAVTDWGNATSAAAAGNSALVCTDGRDALAAENCTGTGGDGPDCDFSCCNGTCGAVPDVQITCQGSTCTCTEGKAKGKVLSVTSCSAASSLDVWNTCGL